MQTAAPSWKYGKNLAAFQAVNVPEGGENGTITVVNAIGWRYLNFAFRYDQIVTLFIRLEIEAPGVVTNWLTLAGIPGQWMTPYDLASPIGDNGFVAIVTPYLQLRINCGAAATGGDFWAYLCNE